MECDSGIGLTILKLGKLTFTPMPRQRLKYQPIKMMTTAAAPNHTGKGIDFNPISISIFPPNSANSFPGWKLD
jgi:hypothetical protein